jgi:hypothetical protein
LLYSVKAQQKGVAASGCTKRDYLLLEKMKGESACQETIVHCHAQRCAVVTAK